MVQDYLFPITDLAALKYDDTGSYKKHKISFSYPGQNLIMRPLHRNDYSKGYCDVLSQLTSVGQVTESKFIERFDGMKLCNNSYYIVVLEDTISQKIIGSGTVSIEHQMSPSLQLKSRGRIEDIVVSNSHRGKFLGQLILDTLDLLAKHLGCDELSLECKDHLIKFYNRFGLQLEADQTYMCMRYSK